MALIKCPNCENEVSDKAVACPNCGCAISPNVETTSQRVCGECGAPLKEGALACEKCGCPIDLPQSDDNPSKEQTASKHDNDSKPKKKRSKKIVIIPLVVLICVGIGVAAFFFITKDSRTYSEAVALFDAKDYEAALNEFNQIADYKDSENYIKDCEYKLATDLFKANDFQSALEKFKTISDYKDSDKYIKKCEFELSVEGRFLRALATGLEKRWKISDKTEGQTLDSATWKTLIDAEYDEIKEFKNAKFKDQKLAGYATTYIELLEDASKVIKYAGQNETTFWNQYNPIYQDRCTVLKKIVEKYTVPVSAGKKSTLDDLVTEGELVDELRKIMDATEFKKVSDSYGWKEYEAIVTNTSSTEFPWFSFDINLVGKDGTVVETVSAYTENWQVGQRNRFTFSTDASFDKIEVHSCNY